jgi:endonuclease/exonuclease/phosphatase family metal-dependent hydrolase
MRVMTFNIRTLTTHDGPNQWHFRRDDLAAMLHATAPDLIGFQEVQKPQLDDLVARLPDYGWYGIGRNDGAEAGEYSPVFWRADRFDRVEAGSFWLAEDCGRPGLGWDAMCVRLASWVVLRDRVSDRELFCINTHLDHMGAAARHEGAKLIADRLGQLAAGRPAILTGDFNCSPDAPPYAAVISTGLRDARLAAANGHTGPIETFPAWRPRSHVPELIDYIFVSPEVTVTRTETLIEDWNGRQISDHRAVIAEIELPSS